LSSFFNVSESRQVNMYANRAVVQAFQATELRKVWVSLDCHRQSCFPALVTVRLLTAILVRISF
jgi:hypothetical protein